MFGLKSKLKLTDKLGCGTTLTLSWIKRSTKANYVNSLIDLLIS